MLKIQSSFKAWNKIFYDYISILLKHAQHIRLYYLHRVSGVFLLCWWPFFTVNIMRAICLRYQVLNYPSCDIDPYLNGFFVWLGYINSFLNPVIYTIFNPEFRKAFKKILTEPCFKRYWDMKPGNLERRQENSYRPLPKTILTDSGI